MLWHDSPWRVLEELCDKNMPGSSINLPVKLLFLNISYMFEIKTTQDINAFGLHQKTKFL